MEKYILKEDIKVYCTTAKSFPDGIQEAFISIEKMLSKEGRNFFGISYLNDNGAITYKAGVSENYEGEADQYGFESFTITKGEYLSETIIDWRNRIKAIPETFDMLLKHPLLDSSFPCIEWYKSEMQVACMVKVNEHKKLQRKFND